MKYSRIKKLRRFSFGDNFLKNVPEPEGIAQINELRGQFNYMPNDILEKKLADFDISGTSLGVGTRRSFGKKYNKKSLKKIIKKSIKKSMKKNFTKNLKGLKKLNKKLNKRTSKRNSRTLRTLKRT